MHFTETFSCLGDRKASDGNNLVGQVLQELITDAKSEDYYELSNPEIDRRLKMFEWAEDQNPQVTYLRWKTRAVCEKRVEPRRWCPFIHW